MLEGKENVAYNYKGNVYCFCPESGMRREMTNSGFEKGRNTLKKLCPAKQMGIECAGQAHLSGETRAPDSTIVRPSDLYTD